MNKSIAKKDLISLSLAIFCMLFGAGNLIFPLTVGRNAGSLTSFGMIGFLLTGILLPLAGLVGMILFDGNYKDFFYTLGKKVGSFLIFISMLIMGPIVVIPRCITLSHTMIAPFLPISALQNITPYSSFIFSLLFLAITFLATYKRGRIVAILGNIIAPILLSSVTFIIFKGIHTTNNPLTPTLCPFFVLKNGFMMGYQTLDLLGAIFFSSIIIAILKQKTRPTESVNSLALNGLKAGLIGLSLLASIYIGMSILGALHGHNFMNINSGELLRSISFCILGTKGALIISIAVLLASISTTIGLGSIFAEYIRSTIFHNSISYIQSLCLTFILCIPLSTIGLKYILTITNGPITHIGYPVIISLTLSNIAYKLWQFNHTKITVLITFLFALLHYITT